jgi:DnaK suppressor protein
MRMQTEKLKALVQANIDALLTLQHEAKQACEAVTLDQSCVGRLSRMDAMQSQAMNLEAQRRRSSEIRRLQSALRRFENDDYGYCEDCGEDIHEGRLMLDPAALYCTACASRRER